jgi:hypothetical protein
MAADFSKSGTTRNTLEEQSFSMWLPPGVRTLSEIRNAARPEDRIPAYATLLELILRTFTPDIGLEPTLNNLIEYHRVRFTSPQRIFFANAVRNDLIHALGRFGPGEWRQAADIFDTAIEDVSRFLSADIRDEVAGHPSHEANSPPPTPEFKKHEDTIVKIVDTILEHISKERPQHPSPIPPVALPKSAGVTADRSATNPVGGILATLAGLVILGAIFAPPLTPQKPPPPIGFPVRAVVSVMVGVTLIFLIVLLFSKSS